MFFIKKVLIIFGGNSSEHYVSCKSAKSIIENIDKKLFEVDIVGIDFDNTWYEFDGDLFYLETGNWKDANINKIDNILEYLRKYDCVFSIIHGNNGEDGKLQGMLELFDIKFVGCNTLPSSCMMDKDISKLLFKSIGLKQVPYITIYDDYKIKDILKEIIFPVIVKPANGGSSIGISKANNRKELVKAIKEAKKYDKKVIIEKFVNIRELEIAVLEDNKKLIISNPGEIKSANEFYDYNAKYINDKSYTIIPNDLSKDTIDILKKYSHNIFTKLGLSGYARIDYFYDEERSEIYINEVNTIPGFTSISMYPKLIENEGISYTNLITKLINNAK